MSPRPIDRERTAGDDRERTPRADRGRTYGSQRSGGAPTGRTCGRPACNQPAEALLAIDGPAGIARLLAVPEEPTTLTLVLCRTHADTLVVPRGWVLLDERAIGRLFASGAARPGPGGAGSAESAGGDVAPGETEATSPAPPRRTPRTPRRAAPAPARVVAEPLALPAEHLPLLHRAFRAASAPTRPATGPEAEA